jgi:hypothetical protein
MKYPIITKENFQEFIEKHVVRKYGKETLTGIEMPKNQEEFKEITKALYGIELDVECLAYQKNTFSRSEYSCKYEIVGTDHDEYSKNPIYKLWDKEFSQYDGLKVLLNTCFGELICGGVAGTHYGQTRCDEETWERVKNWDSNNDTKLLINALEQDRAMKEIFGTNPFR